MSFHIRMWGSNINELKAKIYQILILPLWDIFWEQEILSRISVNVNHKIFFLDYFIYFLQITKCEKKEKKIKINKNLLLYAAPKKAFPLNIITFAPHH